MTAIILLIAGGCKKDNEPAQFTNYNLMVKDVLGVSGTVTFTENTISSATIDIVLVNAPTGNHPANLYMKSEVENGSVAIALNPVDETGKSSTLVSTMNYPTLIGFDGSIKVLSSSTEPDIILAQGDIGGNILTTINMSYTMDIVGAFGVSGTAVFAKRVNENTLITISLTGTIPGETYPATINLGSIASVGGGPVVKELSNVNGTTGKSYTNIQKLEGGTKITYENWLVYDGYLNIYQAPVSIENIICQGNIGSN
ncbi:MAG TPA: hypothetical protein VJY41_03640 [Prolixibacteraceae bacterium]|nr:hypothetical protein [Prolixibacteraceae bacterium]